LTELPSELERDIKSVMGAAKKTMDNEIKTDLGDRDRLIINSRGIVINRIINLARRWAAKIFST